MMIHSRLTSGTGHRMVRDLRERLFAHLQALTLAQHGRMPAGDMTGGRSDAQRTAALCGSPRLCVTSSLRARLSRPATHISEVTRQRGLKKRAPDADCPQMESQAEIDRELSETSTRLALALLGYFVLVTLVITLTPFDFAPRRLELSWTMPPSDVAANVALFLPIGFLVRSLGQRSARSVWRDLSCAAALSILVESGQIFIAGRFVSPIDVATNTCGAYLGILLRERVERWTVWRPHVVGRVGLDVPLVGLLYLLVPQLWLSGVGLVEDVRRGGPMLLLGCAGSIVLVALHRHKWQGGTRLAASVVPPLTLAWFTIGTLPTLAASPVVVAAVALGVLAITGWLLRPAAEPRERRFEADTLGRFVPVFLVYLVVAALWPPLRPLAPWHGAIGFADRLNDAGVVDILLLLEQVGGFTLLGYAAAEWRGRRELTLAQDLPRVIVVALLLSVGLELVQGVLAGAGASAVRALLATSGAMYGAAVYHLARSHVRALRRSEPLHHANDRPQAA